MRGARTLFLACSRPECGPFLQQECVARTSRLDDDIPTVVPIVTDETGEAVVDAQVSVDGVPLTSRVDGRALPVDPGPHLFAFSNDHGVFATRNLVVLRGEHNRRICASVAGGGRARLDAAAGCESQPEETPPGHSPTGPAPRSASEPAHFPGGSPSGSSATSASSVTPPSASTSKEGHGTAGTPTEGTRWDVDATVKVASAYLFRGYNVFQSTSQHDQNAALFGQLSWSVPRTDLSVGYSTVYQLTGDNIAHNIQIGLGAEQVGFVDYDWQPVSHLTITPEIAAMVYPVASNVPFFVEASTEARYEAPIEISIYAGYIAGLRPGPLSENHFYTRYLLEKTFDLNKQVELSADGSFGVKVFQSDPGAVHGNMFDALASVAVSYSFSAVLEVGAGFAMAWTNLEPREDSSGRIVTPRFGDEYVPVTTVTVTGEW